MMIKKTQFIISLLLFIPGITALMYCGLTKILYGDISHFGFFYFITLLFGLFTFTLACIMIYLREKAIAENLLMAKVDGILND